MRIFLGGVVLLGALASAGAQPVVWDLNDGGNGHSYVIAHLPVGVTWAEADQLSASVGGHLATLTSDPENALAYSLIADRPELWQTVGADTRGPWIGGRRAASTLDFDWVTGESFLFTAWAPNEPGAALIEDRVHFHAQGQNIRAPTWNDLRGSDRNRGAVIEFASEPTAVVWPRSIGGNGHGYLVVEYPMGFTWDEASELAGALGGYLATITTAGENTFAYDLVAERDELWRTVGADTRGPWLGGRRIPNTQDFGWLTGEPFVFTAWAPGEPGGTFIEDQVHFHAQGQNARAATWNDLRGSYRNRGFIVEFERICACDWTGDRTVDVEDLLGFLANWFGSSGAPPANGRGTGTDIEGDDDVDINDLLAFLQCWFPASVGAACP